MRFLWDKQNLAHLEEHGVTPAVAEAVFFADDRMVEASIQDLGRYECEGTTRGRMYRLIFAAIREEELYPITCFPIRNRRT